MKINFEVLGVEFGFLAGVRRKLRQPIAGVTNRTRDGYYVLFLDYDEIPYDWLEGEIQDIQDEHHLGELYVFESGKDHYHVVGFDKLTREEYQNILARSSCDTNYKKVPFAWGRRVATLRATEKNGNKIRYYCTIKPRQYTKKRSLSRAHAKFFSGHYSINPPRGAYDNNEDLIIATYRI